MASIFSGLPNDLIIKIVRIGQREADAKEGAKKVSAPFRAGPVYYHNIGIPRSGDRRGCLPESHKIQIMLEKANRVPEEPSAQNNWGALETYFSITPPKYTTPPLWHHVITSFSRNDGVLCIHHHPDLQANQGDGRRLSNPIHKHIKEVGRKLHPTLCESAGLGLVPFMKPIQKKNKFKMMKELLESVPQARHPDEKKSQVPRCVIYGWQDLWNRTICYSFQYHDSVKVLCFRVQKNEMRSPSPDLKRRGWLSLDQRYVTMSQPIIKKSTRKWSKIDT